MPVHTCTQRSMHNRAQISPISTCRIVFPRRRAVPGVIVVDGDTYIIGFDFADNHIIDISTIGHITSKSDSQIHRLHMNLKSVTYMREIYMRYI